MINAVIIDDDLEFIKKFKYYLDDITSQIELQIDLDIVTEPLKILKMQNYDLYFFDIYMPEISGIELASMLRQKYVNGDFIFVSGEEQLVRCTMRVKPIAFIRKSYLIEDMQEVLLVVKELYSSKEKNIILKNNLSDVSLPIFKVKYICCKEHYIMINFTNGKQIIIRNKMKELAKQLEVYGFVRINRSCIINLKYLKELENSNIILLGGESFHISVRYYDYAIKLLNRWQEWKRENNYI